MPATPAKTKPSTRVGKTIKKRLPKCKPTKTMEEYSRIEFLKEILENLISQRNSYDLRTEVIMAISGGIFLFSMKSIVDPSLKGTLGFLVIAVTSLFASILCVFSLRPPDIFINRSKMFRSIIHHRTIFEMSPTHFFAKARQIMSNPQQITDEYLKMIYNISVHQTIRKKYFINQAGQIMVLGLVIGFALMFFVP